MNDSAISNRHWKYRLYQVIFEADTPGGKAFDVALLVCITLSIFAVILESVIQIRNDYGTVLRALEWLVAVL